MASIQRIFSLKALWFLVSLVGAFSALPSAHAKTVACCESSGNGCF